MLTEYVIKLLISNSSYVIVAVPICMPPDGADYTGKVATVSGWGRLKYGGGVPSVLQEVEVRIYRKTNDGRVFFISYTCVHKFGRFIACHKKFRDS